MLYWVVAFLWKSTNRSGTNPRHDIRKIQEEADRSRLIPYGRRLSLMFPVLLSFLIKNELQQARSDSNCQKTSSSDTEGREFLRKSITVGIV